MSVHPESMADELENAKRAIDAWCKLSWAERNREIDKVRAQNLAALKEVRHAELENLRLASRLVCGQEKPELLQDPDTEKKIVVDGAAGVDVGA